MYILVVRGVVRGSVRISVRIQGGPPGRSLRHGAHAFAHTAAPATVAPTPVDCRERPRNPRGRDRPESLGAAADLTRLIRLSPAPLLILSVKHAAIIGLYCCQRRVDS